MPNDQLGIDFDGDDAERQAIQSEEAEHGDPSFEPESFWPNQDPSQPKSLTTRLYDLIEKLTATPDDATLAEAAAMLKERQNFDQPVDTRVLIVVDHLARYVDVYKTGAHNIVLKLVERKGVATDEQFAERLGILWGQEVYKPRNLVKSIPVDRAMSLEELGAQMDEVKARWGVPALANWSTLIDLQRACGNRGSLADIVECLMKTPEGEWLGPDEEVV